MVATRRKNLMSSRRRVEDDGEEEEGSVAIGIEDDSMSEASAISDADDDADAEGSEATDVDTPGSKIAAQISTMNGHVEVARDTSGQSAMLPKKPTTAAMTDTDAMMNGLKISGDLDVAEEIHFDTMANQPLPTPAPNLPVPNQEATTMSDTLAEKRRREHEEYRKKRDADPAFVPNRGGFFMHDHRSTAPGQNGFRPFGRGRGRGRGTVGGPFSQAR